MRIRTITCHDVYNLGAGLQAYALAAYLKAEGHDVQLIDYKPDYLSRHYQLGYVPNPRFDRPLVRQAYLLAKLPGRMKALLGKRKKHFDLFRKQYLPVTQKRYASCDELKQDCPEADVFIAGSDQIWNPVFPNGKDPAFFLNFVPGEKKKISYAASFAVDKLPEADRDRMIPWLKELDAVSIREKSGVRLLAEMGIPGQQVMDPVFLLDRKQWEEIAVLPKKEKYILLYDFDCNPELFRIAEKLAKETGSEIVSVFPVKGADAVWQDMGPREFLGAILNADIVLSNSFHATAFSLIFQKAFYVLNRRENINTRMRDLVSLVSLEDRLISGVEDLQDQPVCWEKTEKVLHELVSESKQFLSDHI